MIKKALALLERYREGIAYLFFGGLATLLNLVLYVVFEWAFGYEAANSWGNVLNNILCILFAYTTNRLWVFQSKNTGKAAWAEFVRFVTCRLGTLVVDVIIMFVGGNLIGPALVPEHLLEWWGLGVKLLANVVVVVLNYVFSKLFIFKKK